ncbi:MAG: DNRLRE domain-containing protein [Chloroflexi bacterium]|nr:DNRLRE domain-containing protein [Chloroflexota bacterium]
MRRTVLILVVGLSCALAVAWFVPPRQPAMASLVGLSGTGQLTGVAWVDVDGAGDLDPDEPRVAWVQMILTGANDFRQEQYTDQEGAYRFTGLDGGYLLDAIPPGGYELFDPGSWPRFVQVQDGQTFTVNVRLRQVGTPAPTPTSTPTPTVTPTVTPTPYWDVGIIEPAYCQGVYLGSTEGGAQRADTYSCVPYWPETGPERVYVLHSAASQWVTVTLNYDPGSADLDVFLLSAPDPGRCEAYGDWGTQISWGPEDLYIVVDGYGGSAGSYELSVACQGGPFATATPTPTSTSTPTITPTPTPTPTATPTPTPIRHLAYLPAWLRAYPPPTPTPTPTPITTRVILQSGQSGYNGTTDTFLNAWDPNTNYGNEPWLSVRYDRPPGPTDIMSSLIRFDLGVLPAKAHIAGAWLKLYAQDRSNDNEIRIAAYQVLRAWKEGQANWYYASKDNPWAQPGCNDSMTDCSALPLDTVTVNALGGWYRWNITLAAQDWVADPGTNQGVILKGLAGLDEANVQYDFASSETGNINRRPQLIIDYWVAP